jgi:hypothetical protein
VGNEILQFGETNLELIAAAVLIWFAAGALAFIRGYLKALPTLRWILVCLIFGPFALILGFVLTRRAPQTEAPRPARRRRLDDIKSLDPFKGKPLFSDDIRDLKREGRLNEAVELLELIIEAIEERARSARRSVPAWYYEQLAVIYRRQGKLEAEGEILKRYISLRPPSDRRTRKLVSRLERIQGARRRSAH